MTNLGSSAAPAGVKIAFYNGDPANGGTESPGSPVLTSRPLYSTETERVSFTLAQQLPPNVEMYVVVDPAPMHAWRERRENNNVDHAQGFCAVE